MELNDARRKRAINMVWTAADRYDFEPQYLFFHGDGEPDLYLNTLEGLAYACMDEEVLMPFLRGLEFGRDPDKFRALAQLVLEQAVFERKKEERPSLLELRKEYAKIHLSEFRAMDRYRELGWERQSLLRCRKILGMDFDGFHKKELELAAALEEAASLSDAQLVVKTKWVFRHFYFYQAIKARKSEETAFVGAGLLIVLMRHLLAGEFHVRSSRGSGNGDGEELSRWRIAWKHLRSETTQAEDRVFVQNTFGPCIYSDMVMQQIEKEYCVGYHKRCRLWYSGSGTADQEFGWEQEEQMMKNRAYYHADRQYYERCIARITTHLKNALEEQQEPDIVHTNSGRLDARVVYRIRAMHDLDVFCREIVYPLPDFTVDLVLDASSSRYHEQEGIAAQAYMIARSLINLHIPVQVVSFRSVRGYTVLQRLKGYGEAESAEGIFRYYTAGNNRDGLALQAIRVLMEQSGYEKQKRIVLVLTDAMPSDAYKAFVPGRLRSSRDYDETLAVEDTCAAVRSLRQNGMRVAAIFWGGNYAVENLRKIYSDSFVRIRMISQLTDAVIHLLLRILAELKDIV
ncbi:MAG: VWA domain-containing protein [Lachnospiraceae bacterium]|nr:VWA domain-containing protein [Lachnospiraceae bacterium]